MSTTSDRAEFRLQYKVGIAVAATTALAAWLAGWLAPAARWLQSAILWLWAALFYPVALPLFALVALTLLAGWTVVMLIWSRRLRTNGAVPQSPTPLSAEATNALKAVGASGKTAISVPALAQRLRLNDIRMSALIGEMEAAGLADFHPPSFSSMSPPSLVISEAGQKLIIDNNWDQLLQPRQ